MPSPPPSAVTEAPNAVLLDWIRRLTIGQARMVAFFILYGLTEPPGIAYRDRSRIAAWLGISRGRAQRTLNTMITLRLIQSTPGEDDLYYYLDLSWTPPEDPF
jgi:hypothetical protein